MSAGYLWDQELEGLDLQEADGEMVWGAVNHGALPLAPKPQVTKMLPILGRRMAMGSQRTPGLSVVPGTQPQLSPTVAVSKRPLQATVVTIKQWGQHYLPHKGCLVTREYEKKIQQLQFHSAGPTPSYWLSRGLARATFPGHATKCVRPNR